MTGRPSPPVVGEDVRMSSSPEPAPPRAFMSYSQDDTAHMGWVQQLAARLVRDGVDVTLDQWDLKAGLNLNLFMESGLTESDRVLVVSSSNYVTKANGRTGGAGFEGNILSADMFNGGLHKDRIIPVIRNNPGGTVPTFLAGAVYVDMRDDSNHEEKYEDLLRTIHGIPKATKPQLGRNPYLRREGELYVPPSMSSSRYVAPALTGEVIFPYSNNSGSYVIGSGEHTFTTHWSNAGHGAIHVYRDGADIHSVALATEVKDFDRVGDASEYDASSRSYTARVGDAVIFRNHHDYYAALLIDSVTNRGTAPSGGLGEVHFRYLIQDNRTPHFGSPDQTSR